MKRLIPWAVITLWMALVMIAACDEGPSQPQLAADTVYVPVPFQTWIGWHYTFADSKPLNNDVETKIRAGWDCKQVLEFPFWVRLLYDDEPHVSSNEIALVMLHAFVCVAPDPFTTAEPMQSPVLSELIGPYSILQPAG